MVKMRDDLVIFDMNFTHAVQIKVRAWPPGQSSRHAPPQIGVLSSHLCCLLRVSAGDIDDVGSRCVAGRKHMRENGAKPGLAGHIIERVDKPHILGQQIKQVINRSGVSAPNALA